MKYLFLLVISIFPLSGVAQNNLDYSIRSYLPNEIKTCRDAVNYYLEPSGYSLTTSIPAPPESSDLLNNNVVGFGKSTDITTIQDALLTLFAYNVALYVDHKNKLVSFGYIKK